MSYAVANQLTTCGSATCDRVQMWGTVLISKGWALHYFGSALLTRYFIFLCELHNAGQPAVIKHLRAKLDKTTPNDSWLFYT